MSDVTDMFNDPQEPIKAGWALGDYTRFACVNCGRFRVCECPNGKTRCEKCNWVEADNNYCEYE